MRHWRGIFTQQDPFGDAGFEGVAKAMRSLPNEPETILRLNYKRNSIDVEDAVAPISAPTAGI